MMYFKLCIYCVKFAKFFPMFCSQILVTADDDATVTTTTTTATTKSTATKRTTTTKSSMNGNDNDSYASAYDDNTPYKFRLSVSLYLTPTPIFPV